MVVYKCIWMQKHLSKSIRIALKKLMIHFKTNINDIKETFFHFFFPFTKCAKRERKFQIKQEIQEAKIIRLETAKNLQEKITEHSQQQEITRMNTELVITRQEREDYAKELRALPD